MDGIWIATIVYALLLFIIAGWWGRRRPEWHGWAWVDVPYYTLAALAAVMFFAADRNIRLEQVEAERQRLRQEWLANPNRQPDVRLQPTAPALVIQSYEGLRTAVRHGEACRQIGSLECSQRVVIGNAVEAAFESFSPRSSDQPEEQARLEEDFCQRGYRIGSALQSLDLIDANAYSILRSALLRQSRAPAPIGEAAPRLETEITHAQQRLQAQLDSDTKPDAEALMTVHGEFATYLFHMLQSCATRPADQAEAIRRLQTWRAETERRVNDDVRVRRAAELATQRVERTPAQRVVKALQERMWPFIILLALALKFGKSVADLTSKRRQCQQKGRPEEGSRDWNELPSASVDTQGSAVGKED